MRDGYSLLNSVEVDLSQYTIEEVNEFEKKRMMKRFIDSKNEKTFWNKKKVLVAAAALILAVNLGIHGGKVLAVATSLKYNIDTWLGINISREKYSTQIGETLERKGTKLTLNEFFTDNSRIIINLNVNKEVNETYKNRLKLIPDVYINGKKVERNSNYVGVRVAEMDENKEESNVTLEVEGKDLPLNNKENVKLVFSTLAKEYGVSDSDFTYGFVYDLSSYKNASKVIKVDKNIIIGENELTLGNVTITPDRVLISGSSKGFSAWQINRDVNYYYDVVDENGDSVSLKEEIGKGAYFYRDGKVINTLKIIPYTFNKINTNTTAVCGGRIKYIIEDKIITVNLK
ncbi:DUF4179 domain-containing protein [Clostridium sp. WILCCON 0269]|uniref:DUF4179 domain-containing protein n=1 Tax=Candidatus Clostridium eludens TaxID=3381663 RepID=A0ABW8SRT0_9CLOT